jgi:hypothetical protein
MEEILILILIFSMFVCFIGLEISHRRCEKAIDRYNKFIINNWNKF